MKKWQKQFMAIVTKLGFVDKVKAGNLTADEQKQIFAKYEKEYNATFQADKEANEDAEEKNDFILSADEQKEIASLITDDNDDGDGDGDGTPPAESPKTGKEANAAMKQTIVNQKKTIKELGSKPEDEKPAEVIKNGAVDDARAMFIAMGRNPHTETHIFGIEADFFSAGKWWNKITKERKEVDVTVLSDSDKKAFMKEFNAYSESLMERNIHLHNTNAYAGLDYEKMVTGTAPFTEYAGLDNVFGEFTVRRQDIIIAFVRSLRNVSHLFPVQSGVRHKVAVPTAQFGELSQGYRKGRIFKGNVKFGGELYWVNDLMFKYEFDDMIALQKRYVADLHRSSSPFQWNFIEWLIVNFIQQLHNEQQRRRVIGVRVPQQDVVANPATLSADGILRAIERAEEELKVLPFEDLAAYDEVSIVDYFEDFWDRLDTILPSKEGILMFANLKHRKWYLRNFRQKYGTDGDFTGTRSDLIDVNPESIMWVPNMPMNCYKMWATYPGNIQNTEYLPNEMLAFRFRDGFESVTVLSRWMEGSVVQMTGVKYDKKEELEAAEHKDQWLFTNFAVTRLGDGATTADARRNTVFLTTENTAATVLTDITNASSDFVYKVICGDMTNKTTIEKSGKFANIKEDWVPTAKGDWIKFYMELEDYDIVVDGETFKSTRPTGNFLELDRKVS